MTKHPRCAHAIKERHDAYKAACAAHHDAVVALAKADPWGNASAYLKLMRLERDTAEAERKAFLALVP